MNTAASLLIATSSAILLVLGLAHLFFTFRGPKLLPRDQALQSRMQEVSPGITKQTTMWRAWIGFNASHSVGLVMFGAVFGYLAIFRESILFESSYLRILGFLVLGGYILLAKKYFFRTPYRASLLAGVLYASAIALAASQ